MNCQHCNSKRILELTAKCSDCCGFNLNGNEHEGFVPRGLGIGGGDYVDFELCLDCGRVQGEFPKPLSEWDDDPDQEDPNHDPWDDDPVS